MTKEEQQYHAVATEIEGAIKSQKGFANLSKNWVISIPEGAIKSVLPCYAVRETARFQFQKVQLKAQTKIVRNDSLNDFNSRRCN